MDNVIVDDEDEMEESEAVWLSKGTGSAARFSDDAKEIVYQMWAFQYAGNARKVSEALERQTPPMTVTERSIRQWAKDGNWAIRRSDDWARIAPDLMRRTVIETRFGLLETAIEMRDIVTNTRTRKISKTIGEMEIIEDVPEVATKDRIAAGVVLAKIESELRAFETPASSSDARAIPPTSSGKLSTDARRRMAQRLGLIDEEE